MVGMFGMVGEGAVESSSMKHGAIPVSEQASPKWTILDRQGGRQGSRAGRQVGRHQRTGNETARWSDRGFLSLWYRLI